VKKDSVRAADFTTHSASVVGCGAQQTDRNYAEYLGDDGQLASLRRVKIAAAFG